MNAQFAGARGALLLIVGALVLALIGLAGAMTDKFIETQQVLEGVN